MAKFGKGDLYDAKKHEMKQHSLLVWVPKNSEYHLPGKDGKLSDQVGGNYAIVMLDQSLFNPDKIKSGEIKLMTSSKEDQGSMKGKVQTNPYLNSYPKSFINKDGQKVTYTDHRTRYTASQMAAIAQATADVPEGKPATNIKYPNGKLYAINASLFIKNKFIPKKDEKGQVIPRKNKKGEVIYRRDKDGNILHNKDGNMIPEIEGHYAREVIINTKGKMGPTKNHKFGLDTLKNQKVITDAANAKYKEMREAAEAKKHDPEYQKQEMEAAQAKGLTANTPAPGFSDTAKTTEQDMSKKMDAVAENLKQNEQSAPKEPENKQPAPKEPESKVSKTKTPEQPAPKEDAVSTPAAGSTPDTPSTDNSLQAGASEPQVGGDSSLADAEQRKSTPDLVPEDNPSPADDEPDVGDLPF